MAYTTESFIKKAKEIYGDKYDYSKVEYKDSKTPITIICKKHGEFECCPTDHLSGIGCPNCRKNEKFINAAKMVHGDKYDYSKVEYEDSKTPVIIVCKKHGEFKCIPSEHLNGKGCIRCKNEDKFIERAKEKYGNKYDYSKVVYDGCNKGVTIICPEHGEFIQTPTLHLNTHVGCPKCGRIISESASHNSSIKTFVEKARKKHGDKYDYSKVQYNSIYDKITVICPKHGEFYPTAITHIHKQTYGGCPECSRENFNNSIKQQWEEKNVDFIRKARALYGDKYDYSMVEYKGMNAAVTIICPVHGEFRLTPKVFLDGKGCRTCHMGKEFIKKAKEKYGDMFDYSKVVYKGTNERVCIIDKENGEFWQTPAAHMTNGKYNGVKKKDGKPNTEKWTYDICKEIASSCTYKVEFFRKCPGAYYKAYAKKWIEDFNWLKEYIPSKNSVIYVYELPNKHAYVGLTNNIEKRDAQHRENNRKTKDYLAEYCIINNIEMPKPKILESGLTRRESGNAEKKWIKNYIKNGWTMINKNGGGGIGSFPKLLMTEEEVINICKNYKNMEELANNNKDVYNLMNKMRIKKKCFPDATFKENMAKPRNYTEEYIIENVNKYDYIADLRNSDPTLFHWLYRHKRLYDFYENPQIGCKKTGLRKNAKISGKKFFEK